MIKVEDRGSHSRATCGVIASLLTNASLLTSSAAVGAETDQAPQTLPRVRVEAADGESYAAKDTTTATKTDTPLLDVPQTINVITREIMEDRGVTHIRDAIELVPGVLPSTGYGGLDSGQVFSRGFFAETTYRDGFRDFSFSSPHDVAVFERIEVLKGPGSVLYGSNEPGGVVNYVSKRPLSSAAYNLKAQIGSYDAKRVEADVTGPIGGDHLAYRLIAAYDDSDSHRDHVSSRTKLVAPSLTWRSISRS